MACGWLRHTRYLWRHLLGTLQNILSHAAQAVALQYTRQHTGAAFGAGAGGACGDHGAAGRVLVPGLPGECTVHTTRL